MARLNVATLQLAAAALGLGLYVIGLFALKWWAYPGWTWRGVMTDVQAISGLLGFAGGFGVWLFQLYRRKAPQDAASEQIREALHSKRLISVVTVLACCVVAGVIALASVGERAIAPMLLADAQQSNWRHAREYVAELSSQPLRSPLLESFRLFVETHDLSERDQLRESRTLRQDRARALQLIEEGEDYYSVNSLSYAELSKAIYFVEDVGNPRDRLAEGISLLTRRTRDVAEPLGKAALIARTGELHLAGKDYLKAREAFEQALVVDTRPASRARIHANIGNTFAAAGDTTRALELYSEAEKAYPEGRLAIFYSNFGYLLMLAKDYEAAKRRVQQALQVDPNDWYSFLNLGLIKESLGEYDDASEDFQLVIQKSSNPDSRREAQVFAGRCLELAGRSPRVYLPLYLAAQGRSTTNDQIRRLMQNPQALADLYLASARSLEHTNTHAIETYIEWFRTRARQITDRPPAQARRSRRQS